MRSEVTTRILAALLSAVILLVSCATSQKRATGAARIPASTTGLSVSERASDASLETSRYEETFREQSTAEAGPEEKEPGTSPQQAEPETPDKGRTKSKRANLILVGALVLAFFVALAILAAPEMPLAFD